LRHCVQLKPVLDKILLELELYFKLGRRNRRRKIMRLRSNEEVLGTLKNYTLEHGLTKLAFADTENIEIPSGLISEKKLKKFIDRPIGILNNEEKYYCKIIKKI
jgi:hypothetical protein